METMQGMGGMPDMSGLSLQGAPNAGGGGGGVEDPMMYGLQVLYPAATTATLRLQPTYPATPSALAS